MNSDSTDTFFIIIGWISFVIFILTVIFAILRYYKCFLKTVHIMDTPECSVLSTNFQHSVLHDEIMIVYVKNEENAPVKIRRYWTFKNCVVLAHGTPVEHEEFDEELPIA